MISFGMRCNMSMAKLEFHIGVSKKFQILLLLSLEFYRSIIRDQSDLFDGRQTCSKPRFLEFSRLRPRGIRG